jgi:membrane fusion protein, multidrug efflux system
MQHSGDAPDATKIMPAPDTSISLREVVRVEPPRPAVAPAEPAPLPEQKADVPAAAGASDPHAAGAARYRRRVLLVLSAIALALGLYWASGYFFAYTDDAYVTSDFVNVAPYISGRIISLHIVDN